jgi:hypothetical protein
MQILNLSPLQNGRSPKLDPAFHPDPLGLKAMEITRLSDEGKVVILQALRDIHHWQAGQELIVIEMGDGILLKPKLWLLTT